VKIVKTPIEGVMIIESERHTDNRGSFSRFFCEDELNNIIGNRQIVQINHSDTQQAGSIRGMHFQFPPHAEMKLIRCLRGRVFDVAVDLRKNSKTFLQWYGQILTPEENNMFVIPEGCAHGFQNIEKNTELLYLHTSHYQPKSEGGFRFDDPVLNIKWPMMYSDISKKDKEYPDITKRFKGIIM
jgi:dTDP-4-dehydrorhamnose 3,5-epimerase